MALGALTGPLALIAIAACSSDSAGPAATNDTDAATFDSTAPVNDGSLPTTDGNANDAGDAANDVSADAIADVPRVDGGQRLGDLNGPTTPNQAPVVVDATHILETTFVGVTSAISPSADIYVLLRTATTPLRNSIAKYNSSFQRQWLYQLPSTLTGVQSIAVNASGEVFFGGTTTAAFPGETQNSNAGDAVIGKISAAGALVWAHQWGLSGHPSSTSYVALGPSGAVVGIGTCGGQAPGNPPANAGGTVGVRYEADGSRTWLTQYPPSNGNPSSLLVDTNGRAYWGRSDMSVGVKAHITALDTNGTPTSYVQVEGAPNGDVFDYGSVALAPAGAGFYSFVQDGLQQSALYQLGFDGRLTWYRQTASQSMPLPGPGGVVWTGSFTSSVNPLAFPSPIAVSSDSLFLSGFYINNYMNGLPPPPFTGPMYVGRYDFSGQVLWFQELLFSNPDAGVLRPGDIAGLVVAPNGDVVALTNIQYQQPPLYAVRLSKATGQVVP